MQVNQIAESEFKPIRLEIVLETKEEVRLFRTLVANNVTIPNALIDADLLSEIYRATFKTMMSQLNEFES